MINSHTYGRCVGGGRGRSSGRRRRCGGGGRGRLRIQLRCDHPDALFRRGGPTGGGPAGVGQTVKTWKEGGGRPCYCESGHFEGEPTSSLRNQLCHDITVHSLKVPQLHGITVHSLKVPQLHGITVQAYYLKRHIYTALGVHIT